MGPLNLLSGASTWNSASPDKKKPSMYAPHRKTQKRVNFAEDDRIEQEEELVKEGFAQRQSQNQERISKVESIIEQMNNLDLENDGSDLANFNPIPRPELQPLEDLEVKFPAAPKIQDQPNEPSIKNNYLANDPRLFDNLKTSSSYENSYNGVPYYAKMGGPNRHFPSENGNNQSMLIEKLNYMIHLLEQQQFEKTDNIMEEFFLYLLLGGFMIYVVDSFTKTGKYIR